MTHHSSTMPWHHQPPVYLTTIPVPARSLHNPRSPAIPQRLILFTTHRSKTPRRSHRLKWSWRRAFVRLLRRRRRICYRHSTSVTQLMESSMRRVVWGVRPTQMPLEKGLEQLDRMLKLGKALKPLAKSRHLRSRGRIFQLRNRVLNDPSSSGKIASQPEVASHSPAAHLLHNSQEQNPAPFARAEVVVGPSFRTPPALTTVSFYKNSMSATQLMEFSLRRAVTGVRPTQMPS